MQDFCLRIFASGSLFGGALSLHQDAFGEHLCKISVEGLCIRILLEHLYQDPLEPLGWKLGTFKRGTFKSGTLGNLVLGFGPTAPNQPEALLAGP